MLPSPNKCSTKSIIKLQRFMSPIDPSEAANNENSCWSFHNGRPDPTLSLSLASVCPSTCLYPILMGGLTRGPNQSFQAVHLSNAFCHFTIL
ncbi:hypothetical protein XELAEV_18002164mg [Xenopus laevis]|uniref:Uncharacterized protein n=1 Tax=Xenopus laevis TaxID=8355 RepID=A0A974BP67_XENLA|nr:hypothetical protein XELAEV_18002164mg [Xenopus laevis]